MNKSIADQARSKVFKLPAKIAHKPNPTDNKLTGHTDQVGGSESSVDRYTTEVMIIASMAADNAHAYGQEILSSRKVVMKEKLICDFPRPNVKVSGIINRKSIKVNHTIVAVNADMSQDVPVLSRKKGRQNKVKGIRTKKAMGNRINIGIGFSSGLSKVLALAAPK